MQQTNGSIAPGVNVQGQSARSVPPPPVADATVEVVRANYALYQMEQTDPTMIDQVIAELKKAKITVNPRYGRFDAATLEMVPVTPNWVVGQP